MTSEQAQMLVFVCIAGCTFMLKGKQWPTMITTFIATWFLAGETWDSMTGAFGRLFDAIQALFS